MTNQQIYISYLKTRYPISSVKGHVKGGFGRMSAALHHAIAGKEMADEHSQTITMKTVAFLPDILAV